jgi:hypothetical protein
MRGCKPSLEKTHTKFFCSCQQSVKALTMKALLEFDLSRISLVITWSWHGIQTWQESIYTKSAIGGHKMASSICFWYHVWCHFYHLPFNLGSFSNKDSTRITWVENWRRLIVGSQQLHGNTSYFVLYRTPQCDLNSVQFMGAILMRMGIWTV